VTTFRLSKAEAALLASLNALAVAKEHLGDLDRLKKLLKLTVVMATTEQFAEHPSVADGALNLLVPIFGPKAGHVRLVYGVQGSPVGTPFWSLTQYSKSSQCLNQAPNSTNTMSNCNFQ
jgi:YjgF/chorismate_mutase-like, putative endoribonuclease